MWKRDMKSPIPATVMLSALLIPVLLACDWKSDGLERVKDKWQSPEHQGGDEDISEIELPESEFGGSTAGVWLAKVVVSGDLTEMPLVDDMPINIRNYFVAEIPADESKVKFTFCDQDAEVTNETGGPLGKTEVKEPLREALAKVSLDFQMDNGAIAGQSVYWLWGLHEELMVDPSGENLPTDPNEDRVWDQDGDGNPGVSVFSYSPEGYRYLVRRAIWNLEKADVTDNFLWMTGLISSATVDQNSVGASNSLLKTPAPIVTRETGHYYQLRHMEPLVEAADGDLDPDVEAEIDPDGEPELENDTEGPDSPEADPDPEAESAPDGDSDTEHDVEIEGEAESRSNPGRVFRKTGGELTPSQIRERCGFLLSNPDEVFKDAPGELER